MKTTFVTSFQHIRKEADCYVDIFHKLAKSGISLLVFTDVPEEIPVYPNVRTVPLEVDMIENPILPTHRNIEKDTAPFMCLMLSKLKCLVKALEYTDTPYLAWIDFKIFYIIRHTELAQEKLRALSTRSFPGLTKLLTPGCWDPVPTFDILSSICWRFCGGFLLGPRDIVKPAYARQCELVRQYLPHLTWEVNYWSRMEEFFEWYKADHNDSMIMDMPYSPRILRPGATTYYVDGGQFRRVHVGKAIEQALFRAFCKVSEDGTLIIPKTDMVVESNEYRRMKESVPWDDPAISDEASLPNIPNSIVCLDTSRDIRRSNVFYYPLDDDTLQNGLQWNFPVPEWSSRRPLAIWRGGTSGVERPTARMRVVDALQTSPYADVKFVRGGWPQNDAGIPDHHFGDKVSMQDHAQYKYMFSIDGNGAASSLQWMFATGCVPILVMHPSMKMWFSNMLVPMKHYVPIAYDLSDLHEKLQWLVEHDEDAEQIAKNALEFGKIVFSSAFQESYITNQMKGVLLSA